MCMLSLLLFAALRDLHKKKTSTHACMHACVRDGCTTARKDQRIIIIEHHLIL
jgi:hypothetical protein